jgi:hypothetical protein
VNAISGGWRERKRHRFGGPFVAAGAAEALAR